MKHQIKIGAKYNYLTTVCISNRTLKNGMHLWQWKCDCGRTFYKVPSTVIRGITKSCGCRRWSGDGRIKANRGVATVLHNYKRHAHGLRVSFNIDVEQAKDLMMRPCFYCGVAPSNVTILKAASHHLKKFQKPDRTFIYSGLDRWNNKKGYTLENLVPCCITCNRGKHAKMSGKEFQEYLIRAGRYSSRHLADLPFLRKK